MPVESFFFDKDMKTVKPEDAEIIMRLEIDDNGNTISETCMHVVKPREGVK